LLRTSNHHNLDSCKTKRADCFTNAVLRRVLKRNQTNEGILFTGVLIVRSREWVVHRVFSSRKQRLGTCNDSMTSRSHVLRRVRTAKQTGLDAHIVGSVILSLEFIRNWYKLSIFQVGGTFCENTFWGSFDIGCKQALRMRFIDLESSPSSIWKLATESNTDDDKGPFVCGVERNCRAII